MSAKAVQTLTRQIQLGEQRIADLEKRLPFDINVRGAVSRAEQDCEDAIIRMEEELKRLVEVRKEEIREQFGINLLASIEANKVVQRRLRGKLHKATLQSRIEELEGEPESWLNQNEIKILNWKLEKHRIEAEQDHLWGWADITLMQEYIECTEEIEQLEQERQKFLATN